MPEKVKQRKYDLGMQESPPVLEVEKFPIDMNGLVRYTIVKAKTWKEKRAALLTDGRRWKKSNVTQWKQYGELRYADCRGSFSASMDSVLFVFNFV